MKEELQKPIVEEEENWVSAYSEETNLTCPQYDNNCGLEW